ncbi:hypothetical protein [Solitalea longa]|nr:hypothetical protein [Solitalea longa]
MKTFFFDTHNDSQFNRNSWMILILCMAISAVILFTGVFSDYRWTILLAYCILLPGLIVREWYNLGHNGFAFALTVLFLVVATLYVLFLWTGFLHH